MKTNVESFEEVHPSIELFLRALDLPSHHPYNLKDDFSSPIGTGHYHQHHQDNNSFFENRLPASPMASFLPYLIHEENPSVHSMNNNEQHFINVLPSPPTCPVSSNLANSVLLSMKQIVPPFVAALHLFFRLLAPLILMICVISLGFSRTHNNMSKHSADSNCETCNSHAVTRRRRRCRYYSLAAFMSMLCVLTIMTDSMYVQEYGRAPLVVLYCVVSSIVIFFTPSSSTTKKPSGAPANSNSSINLVLFFTVVSLVMIKRCDMELPQIDPGFYYDKTNSFVNAIVDRWPVEYRTYKSSPWVLTGDARTGIPFFLNRIQQQTYVRRWVPIQNTNVNKTDPGEAILIDIAFPPNGIHRVDKPIYIVLCGLTGNGQNEEFVKDFVMRRRNEGSTILVVVARGLPPSTVFGHNLLNFASTSDIELVANVARRAVAPNQTLAGVGYSMGAIVLANYVARSGHDCALDAAVSISGALNTREQIFFRRSQTLWQKLIVLNLRTILTTTYIKQLNERLTKKQIMQVATAPTMTALDEAFFVRYHNYTNIGHYYSELGAMADYDTQGSIRMNNVAIPLLVVNALDDPIAFHQTMGNNPKIVSESGSGFTMLLLTQKGGHVGWPIGMLPWMHGFSWMNDLAFSFIQSVANH